MSPNLLLTLITLNIVSARSLSGEERAEHPAINRIHDPRISMSNSRYLKGFIYDIPNDRTGKDVANWQANMTINPEELGTYIEGDILFLPGNGRNGLKGYTARWPRGVVPYVISPYFNTDQRRLIYEAMNDYHKYTCIRFKPYLGEETDYIRITAGNSGCWSSVGRIGGWQNVNLQVPGCVTRKGTVIHELMHAIGFLHEQNRFERDRYVSIRWDNILNGHERNFEKASRDSTSDFGIGYDYASVMHYSSYAFSKNGKPTIVPKGTVSMKLGQREGFSKTDIEKIRKMYKCNRKG